MPLAEPSNTIKLIPDIQEHHAKVLNLNVVTNVIFLFQGAEGKLNMIRAYRSQVEKELRDICSDILGVLDKHLIPSSQTGESKVFYYKMKVNSRRKQNFTAHMS